MGKTSALRKADILRALPDDAETDARQEEGELPVIPTKGRSSLVSRDAAPALTPPGVASGPSAAPSSAPGAHVPTPQAPKLSGFRLPKRKADYVAAAAASKKEKQAAAKAVADREAALKDAEAARDRCRELEDELKSLHDQCAEEARGGQAKEEEMRAREDAIKGCDAKLGELGKAQALEEVVEGIGSMAEAEARVLSSAALTRVFSHLYLRDPSARLDELLEPVADEHCTATAAAVKGQVEALLKKFRGFVLAPSIGDATDPMAPSGGAGEGDATDGGAPSAGDGGVQE
nr:uncharacterized protein LOC109746662 [Aegilops tauschii subsp. strangulata]